jgi:putative molybdopterin biosynthesis protein
VTAAQSQSGTERACGMAAPPGPDLPSGTAAHACAHVSPVAAPPADEAFRTWMRTCAVAGWTGVLGTETVAVTAARGRVTAEPVRACWPVPAYRAAAMDGIAVTTASLNALASAASTSGATGPGTVRLPPEDFDRVDTGDPVSAGRDAVIMRERVTFTAGGAAEVCGPAIPGQHIRPVGEDIDAGVIMLPAGHRVRPADAAALAAAGHTRLVVRRRPKVAILPTGSEIRPVGTSLAPGEILDTNSIMLTGLAEEAGCTAETLPIAPDAPEHIAAAAAAAARTADIVLIIAGSSAGRDDHTSYVVGRLGQVAVHGVAMRPGHPVVLGVLGGVSGNQPNSGNHIEAVPVIGIPGYPASAERTFTCFARPLLRRILDTGAQLTADHDVPARLAGPIVSAEHLDEYVRVRLARVIAPRAGHVTLVAVPLPRGAGALNALAQTEAIVRIPVGMTGYPAGSTVRPVLVEGAAFSGSTIIVNGPRSPAADILIDQLRAALPESAVHWHSRTEHAAVEALAEGLCHAAALTIDAASGRPDDQAAASLADRLGPITLLELARTGEQAEVLVIPAAAFDSLAVEELRTVVGSRGYRLALREIPSYSARSAGHETWHGPGEHPR